ncbi:phosphoribosylformimino-5-aminoimidazole carboxamide ribotide isomerase [Clostridium cylindrosporum]|uniref:1-(5-phosphoribosyl)-5-[(5-phosphoribosylamino)methylideneamino] imidazole-4-carboxamide isomerase n=1 Tax=Clostridium cylindrosporum DSM 605 TaxID=1121307 RepID=A0A0J8D4N1_CLOCY|nr:phosphoribosylformimino-5-aminoimidazole carboxamide ribotide isomerase [Clostridium cylindrosporum]KMT20777.1 1-(5-phosphoribosyl)-5-[(5-phosphoribosylamino)methylideneamino] imidazole-4-carboxamide isomerase [Clostridium cylindrosporum DSM 605]
MRLRPCIDIHSGRVKQIVGGSLSDKGEGLIENFISDKEPSYYGEMFQKDNLTAGHVIMLGPGNTEAALEALKSYPSGLQVGGGINSDNAKFYLDNGASHVIITSFVFKDGEINWENLNKVVEVIGKEKLVLDLSCRKKDGKYYVVTDRWQKYTNFELNKDNIAKLEGYCDEFLVHAVDVEGQCRGIQEDLVELLGEWVTIPTTYAGGVHTFEDIETIKRLGQNKIDVTIGSALDIFGGNLSYSEVVEYFEKLNK